jgi:hypothetical protein
MSQLVFFSFMLVFIVQVDETFAGFSVYLFGPEFVQTQQMQASMRVRQNTTTPP